MYTETNLYERKEILLLVHWHVL